MKLLKLCQNVVSQERMTYRLRFLKHETIFSFLALQQMGFSGLEFFSVLFIFAAIPLKMSILFSKLVIRTLGCAWRRNLRLFSQYDLSLSSIIKSGSICSTWPEISLWLSYGTSDRHSLGDWGSVRVRVASSLYLLKPCHSCPVKHHLELPHCKKILPCLFPSFLRKCFFFTFWEFRMVRICNGCN